MISLLAKMELLDFWVATARTHEETDPGRDIRRDRINIMYVSAKTHCGVHRGKTPLLMS
jgi:hypothetical protein